MSGRREELIRENFEYERDFNYLKFRELHWTKPEIVKACPEEWQRDKALRGFWNHDAEKRYPEYRAAVASMTTAELENERQDWVEKLERVGMLDMRRVFARAAERAANDNAKEDGHER